MKANELRIGNWVKLPHVEKPIQVFIIDTTETTTKTKAEPLPLTEEWLLKFGFAHTHNTPHPNRVFMKSWTEGYFELEEIVNYFWGGSDYSVELEYVHQLQNLYFALTNEELTLTP